MKKIRQQSEENECEHVIEFSQKGDSFWLKTYEYYSPGEKHWSTKERKRTWWYIVHSIAIGLIVLSISINYPKQTWSGTTK